MGGTVDMTTPPKLIHSWGSAFAALVAFGLGSLAAVMMVVGHQPWDGPELMGLTATHGVHLGDALAIVPFCIGVALAWWCLSRWSSAEVARLMEAQAQQLRQRSDR